MWDTDGITFIWHSATYPVGDVLYHRICTGIYRLQPCSPDRQPHRMSSITSSLWFDHDVINPRCTSGTSAYSYSRSANVTSTSSRCAMLGEAWNCHAVEIQHPAGSSVNSAKLRWNFSSILKAWLWYSQIFQQEVGLYHAHLQKSVTIRGIPKSTRKFPV